MNLLMIFLMGQPPQGEKGGGYDMLIMFALLIVVFYFFFIRPQQKKSKETRKFRETMQKGDKVLTIGGVHGKVSEIKEKTVVLELIDKGRVEIEKSAIAGNVDTARDSIGKNA